MSVNIMHVCIYMWCKQRCSAEEKQVCSAGDKRLVFIGTHIRGYVCGVHVR